jgi:hypothetical protein
LEKYWESSDLWPMPRETEPHISDLGNQALNFRNFCPEVTFDFFGYFASHLYSYPDEIDRDYACDQLSRAGTNHDNWDWTWAGLFSQHYTECLTYSLLLAGVQEVGQPIPKRPIGF